MCGMIRCHICKCGVNSTWDYYVCSKDVDFIINCECVFSVKVWIFFPLKCVIHIKTVMIRSRENLVSNYLPFFHYISLEKEALIKQSLLLCSCSYTASMDAPKVLNLAFCQLPRGTEGTRTEHHPFFLAYLVSQSHHNFSLWMTEEENLSTTISIISGLKMQRISLADESYVFSELLETISYLHL